MPRRRSRRVVTELRIRGGFRRPQVYVLGCRGRVALVGRAPLPFLPLFNGDGRHSRLCCSADLKMGAAPVMPCPHLEEWTDGDDVRRRSVFFAVGRSLVTFSFNPCMLLYGLGA